MDLTTRYLGLTLSHPFMPGASPLADSLDRVLRLEDAGAAAIVLRSLFAEQVTPGARSSPFYPGVDDYVVAPDRYFEQLHEIKTRTGVPVIASLNGTTADAWLNYARLVEQAGADAIELNCYHIATDPAEDGRAAEHRVLDIVAVLKETVRTPIAVKLTPFYSSLPNMVRQLANLGADGVVLFNRFLQPAVDPDTPDAPTAPELSTPAELPLRLQAVAALAGRVSTSLALSGGVHEPLDAVKAILAGADVVQLVSALYTHGPGYLTTVRRRFDEWGDVHECRTINGMRGTLSLKRCGDPHAFERGRYVRLIQSWAPMHSRQSPVVSHQS